MSRKLFEYLTTKETGDKAELAAETYLKKKGFKAIARQYKCKFGELDLVMLDANTLVFVEVRYRQTSSFGSAADTVVHRKQRRVILSAQHFLQSNTRYQNLNCRFDVVAAKPDKTETDSLILDWIQNAFQC